MATPRTVSISLVLLLLLSVAVLHSRSGEQPARTAGARQPVIVELFTSEGCSSCPPADALLRKFESEQPVPNAEIIVLGEHVDYWNYIGWTDRFSSSAFSERQTEYARRFRLDSIYTPQMVVDGRVELNGTDESAAKRTIARSAATPKANLTIRFVGTDPAASELTVQITGATPELRSSKPRLMLAVTESELETQVKRGENGGRMLRHTGVVRTLKPLTHIDPRKPEFTATATLRLEKAWQRKHLRIVAFLQEPEGSILSAISAALPE